MSTAHKLVLSCCASIALVCSSATAAEAQEPSQAKAPAAPARHAAATNETYVLRTYDVGDLVISVQDHPYRDALQHAARLGGESGGGGGGFGGGGGGLFSVPDSAAIRTQTRFNTVSGAAPRMMLCQFGGAGGGRAASGEAGAASPAAGPTITISDLVRVIIGTVAYDTWAQNGGGDGKVEPLGTALVVWQTPAVHQQIERLLDSIRQTSGQHKTVTIDARWLLLNSDELDSLITPNSTGIPQVDRKALAGFTRRSGSIRGLITCFSGQLVYLVSGTRRNIVSGYIPVVGALDNGNGGVSLVSSRSRSQIQLVADVSSAGTAAREPRVGYQPIVANPNFGALLEIRPTLVGSGAIVDLKSTLTALGDQTAEVGRGTASDTIAPAVDRVAIETQEFATTLRVPDALLGKPVLVGGLTYVSGSMKASKGSESTDRPQFYLVLEIH